jgi:peptide/nickel transport system substrate-binding protein
MRKLVTIGLGGVLLALLVSACGGSSSGGTVSLGTEAKVSEACQGSPVRGGSLVYARQYETVTLNPLEIKNGAGDIFADEMLYSTLVRLNPEGGTEIVPGLAESWKVTDGGKVYTFKMRQGLKFSDGTPVTAEDVTYSLENFGNPEINSVMAVLTTGFKSVRSLDETTIQVELTEPVAAFLYNIAEFPAAIFPKVQVEEEGASFWKHPVGTGPFKLKEFASGSHLTMVRNPYYWEKGKPYLDSVRFDFAVEGNSRVLSLKSGQAQIADGIPYSQIPSLQSDAGITLQKVRVPAWIMLALNNDVKPLGELDVRTAINYALNREEINQTVFKGVGTMPTSLFGELKFDSKSVEPYEFNLEKAKEYMAKSQYPTGFSVTFDYPAGFDYYKQMMLLVQQELAAIGIKVKLEETAAATVAEKWSSMEYEGSFPFAITSSDIVVPDEYAGFFALPSSETNGFFTGWNDPSIAKQVEKFQTTTSEASRAKQWPVIQKELFEQSPAINIMDVPFINAHGSEVCGTAVNSLGLDNLQLTWLSKES